MGEFWYIFFYKLIPIVILAAMQPACFSTNYTFQPPLTFFECNLSQCEYKHVKSIRNFYMCVNLTRTI